jgi:hypothetical protein
MDKIDINAWQCMTAYRLQYIYIYYPLVIYYSHGYHGP